MIRIEQDDKEIRYQYRGDGLRHSSEVRNLTESSSKINVFYWDGSNIVAEQTDGEGVKRYLRGINLLAGEIDGMVYYYILNEHGDVAQMRGACGAWKLSYEYDGFGNEKEPYEEDRNPFRYCGEYLDLSSDTYYLRARSYRPTTSRFLTGDPINARLNWYCYCENNPVNIEEVYVALHGSAKEYNGKGYGFMYFENGSRITTSKDIKGSTDSDVAISDLGFKQIKHLKFSSCNTGNPDIINVTF